MKLNNLPFLFTTDLTAPNCRYCFFHIACRLSINTLVNVSIIIIICNLDCLMICNTISQVFNSATIPINPILQIEFRSINIFCGYYKALHWLIKNINFLITYNPFTFIFESCCKKGPVQLNAFQNSPIELKQLF